VPKELETEPVEVDEAYGDGDGGRDQIAIVLVLLDPVQGLDPSCGQ
jgi:hypothetical protein